MNTNNLSPIILFVFSRPDHTREVIKNLVANELACKSDLIVYADAARSAKEVSAVNEVRRIVKRIHGFRSVTVVERQTNYGLARNIIEAVGEVCKKYGRAIVLEDDLITSPNFLTFMNEALDRYQDEKQVWHISGWNYPIDANGLDEAFFVRVMNCWGWATWEDRWRHFEKNTDRLISEFDREMIREFDLDNSGIFWSQILSNQKGRINTWAIYWYATIFKNNGLCLNPAVSYVDNIGLDGTGTHRSQERRSYATQISMNNNTNYPREIKENSIAIERIIKFYQRLKPTLASRIKKKIHSAIYKAVLK